MRRPLRDFALRLVVIAAILLTLGRVFGTAVVTPMLPAMAWVIEAVDDRFRVERVRIADRKADTFIELRATPVRMSKSPTATRSATDVPPRPRASRRE